MVCIPTFAAIALGLSIFAVGMAVGNFLHVVIRLIIKLVA